MPRQILPVLTLLSAVLAGIAASATGDESGLRPVDLEKLARIHEGQTMRASSSDPNWQSGNKDARPIEPGQALTIADIEGPGVIRHIWFTLNTGDHKAARTVVLRMYWDNDDEPAVESPIGDFFALGLAIKRNVDSIPVAVTSEGRAYNCYWTMPFTRHARITLTNENKKDKVGIYWYVDYEKVPALPANTAYFHAQYRQEYPARLGQNYLILDTEGTGHYVGTVLSVYQRTKGWFGEGDDFFFIDGQAEPTLRGTGTEDYFCDAWAFREFCRPYYGVVLFEGFEVGDRVSAYRWHIKDPVRFTRSLKVEIEHKGTMYDDQGAQVSPFHERADLYSSVAFWYQTGKPKRFAPLPPARERLIPAETIELETCRDDAKAVPAETKIEAAPSTAFSNGKQLLARFTEPTARLTIPFKLDSRTKGIARLRLATSSDSGIWSVALDGKTVIGSADLYSPSLAVREFRLGSVELDIGQHALTLECKGRNPDSTGYLVGVDALSIEDVTPYSVPAVAK